MSLTPRQIVLRDRMEAALDRIVDARHKHGQESIQCQQAIKAYDALSATVDPNEHCCISDPDLYSLYSDFYKEVHNFRPRGHVTKAQARAWIDQQESVV